MTPLLQRPTFLKKHRLISSVFSFILILGLLSFAPLQLRAVEAMEDIANEHSSHQSSLVQESTAETASSYEIIIDTIKDQGLQKNVTFSLINQMNQTPLTLDDLAEVHTKKLHLLIINEALDDYHHIHPEATATPGKYTFSFTPKPNAHYKMWADITPKTTNQQIFLMTDLIAGSQAAKPTEKSALRSTVYPYSFALSFDKQAITVGTPVIGKIVVRDLKQRPIKSLEPVMSAFAHIVTFSSDFTTINHAHPIGTEPKSEQDRGGPTLEFHYEPTHPGFVKLYAQVRINGQDIFVPFVFFVK